MSSKQALIELRLSHQEQIIDQLNRRIEVLERLVLQSSRSIQQETQQASLDILPLKQLLDDVLLQLKKEEPVAETVVIQVSQPVPNFEESQREETTSPLSVTNRRRTMI